MESYQTKKAGFVSGGEPFTYFRHFSTRAPAADEGSPGDFWRQSGSQDVVYVKGRDNTWDILTPGSKMRFPSLLNPSENFQKYRPDPSDLTWRIMKKGTTNKRPRIDEGVLSSPKPNNWVDNLVTRWRAPFSVLHHSSTAVEKVLNHLSESQLEVPFFRGSHEITQPGCFIRFYPTPHYTLEPSLNLILADIIASEPQDMIVSHAIVGHLTQKATLSDILFSFLAATSRSSMHDGEETALYSVLKVPFTEKGMGACQLGSPFPEDFDGVYDHTGRSTAPNWSSAFTPPGSITKPHIDWYGAGEMMYHVGGEKMWFLWPATVENLESLYEWRHSSPNADPSTSIVDGIMRFRGLQVVHFTEPCLWELPSCMIHACIGFSHSGHLGVSFWSRSGFPTARWTIEFFLKKCQACYSGQCDDTQDTLEDFLDVSQRELLRWKSLVTRGGSREERDWIEKTLDSVKTTQQQLNKIRG
ncbi:hypothetical protein PM082_002283 [Marasmius tenuissimus]|nr:hypothetical protein PM082_002283 [Marasmius tenuissimus]